MTGEPARDTYSVPQPVLLSPSNMAAFLAASDVASPLLPYSDDIGIDRGA